MFQSKLPISKHKTWAWAYDTSNSKLFIKLWETNFNHTLQIYVSSDQQPGFSLHLYRVTLEISQRGRPSFWWVSQWLAFSTSKFFSGDSWEITPNRSRSTIDAARRGYFSKQKSCFSTYFYDLLPRLRSRGWDEDDHMRSVTLYT